MSVALARSHRRPLAACAALAFAAAGLAIVAADQHPAEAQTISVTSLVKNTGRSNNAEQALSSGVPRLAQVFTAGTGAVLDSIGINFQGIHADADPVSELTVTLQTVSNSNRPNGVLCTLSNPATISPHGVAFFEAPPTTESGACPRLSAGTKYAVMIARANSTTQKIALGLTTSDSEDSGKAPGWSIRNTSSGVVSNTWHTIGNSVVFRIDVKGYEFSDAEGEPTITGVAGLGHTLTADTSGITDANGLTGVEYNYQWIRVDGGVDADISGATNSTYTLGDDDEGKTVKVKVTFTDDDGYSEELTSEESPAIAALDTADTATQVSNTGQLGQGDLGVTSSLSSGQVFTTGPNSFGYELDSVGVYTDFAPGIDVAFKEHMDVALHALDGDGLPESVELCTLNDPASDDLFIDGGVSTYEAPSGCPLLVANRSYAVVVSHDFGTDVGNEVGHTSHHDDVLVPPTGWTIADQRLILDRTNDTWSAVNNFALRIAIDAAPHTGPLVSTTGQRTVSNPAELDATDTKLAQSFTTGDNPGGFGLSSIGIKFGTVSADSQPDSELTVTLNEGGADPGAALCTLANPSTFTADSVLHFEAPATGNGACPLLDESTSYFVVVERANNTSDTIGLKRAWDTESIEDTLLPATDWTVADVRHRFRSGSWESQPKPHQIEVKGTVLAPRPIAFVSGTPVAGQSLIALTSGVADADRLAGTGFSYRWIRTDAGTSADIDIANATSSSYTLTPEDVGATVRVRVSFTDIAGNTMSFTSGRTAAVAAAAAAGSQRVTDIRMHNSQNNPLGVWGNTTTIWVANDESENGDKLYAYRRSDGSRDTASDFDSLRAAGNQIPTGVCSDGTTMFVADQPDDKVYAYKMSDRSHDAAKDITLAGSNTDPVGLWCDANTVWVVNDAGAANNKIYAYKRSDGSRDTAKDFDELYKAGEPGATNNTDPKGLWSNGETMFVVDQEDNKIYAYSISDGSEDSAKNIDLHADNAKAHGLWFDGRVLWVSDRDDEKLYAYDLPGAHTRRTFWSGTATVRTHVGDSSIVGYESTGVSYPSSALDDTGFGYGAAAFSVRTMHLSALNSELVLSLAPTVNNDVSQNWELVLGDANSVYELPAGTHNISPEYTNFVLNSVTASWSDAEQVELSLRAVPAAPTGAPALTGTAQVSQSVIADTSGIADANGVSDDAFAFQWIRVDAGAETDIDGAVSQSYFPTDDDVGKQLKVRVTFDDDAGFEAYPLTSETSAEVEPPPETAAAATQVSNSGQTAGFYSALTSSTTARGQAFRTGPNLHGYVLESVGLVLDLDLDVSRAGSTRVRLHEQSSSAPGDVLCTLDNPAFTALISDVERFAFPSSGAACPALAPNTTYFAVVDRTGSNLASTSVRTTDTGQTGEDVLDPATGWTIGNNRHHFTANWGQLFNQALYLEVRAAPIIGPMLSTAAQAAESGGSALDATTPKRAQAFTTGAGAGGYRLSSVEIDFEEIHASSQPAGELTATLNQEGTDGHPGDALCTLTDPDTFAASGLHRFGAPTTGDGACPRLLASTSYYFVIERANSTTQAISLKTTASDAEDTIEPTTGWTAENTRRDFEQTSSAWSSATSTYLMEVRGRLLVSQPNSDPTGAPAVSGTPTVGQTLIALTSGIDDADGLTTAEFEFRWVRTKSGTDTDIAGAQSQNYTLSGEDEGATVKVRVSFADDGATEESLTSATTAAVAAAAAAGSQRLADIRMHNSQQNPTGVWGNTTTIWVANNWMGNGDKLYAYRRSDGGRDTASDFNTLSAAGNQSPTGVCSDGTTMFVADIEDDKVYAYKMSDRSHDSAKDFTLHSGNTSPGGLWCDADTVWVSNDGSGANNKVFAYKRSDGLPDTAKEFDSASANAAPKGLWSNGETMFVVDQGDNQIYAYSLADGSEDSAKKIDLRADNAKARGLWFDGRVLWVSDPDDDKLYAYDLPGAHTRRTFWSGTATVTANSSGNAVGYDAAASTFPSSALDDDGFGYGATQYSVEGLSLNATSSQLKLTLTPTVNSDVSQNWELVLGDAEHVYALSGAAATHDTNADTTTFQLDPDTATWSASEQVEVSLRAVPSAATGVPAVSGDAQLTQRVTADVSAIADANGVSEDALVLQWIRVDGSTETEIDGATSPTYDPTDDDLGKQLKIRAVFNDDAGYEAYPLTSEASTEVEPPPETVEAAVQVKNTGQDPGGEFNIDNSSPLRAQAFTTGPSPHGYVLESVGFSLRFGSLARAGMATVRLHGVGDGGNPGAALCTLDDPAAFTSDANDTERFTAPASGTLCPKLAPNATYIAVVSREGPNPTLVNVRYSSSAAEDALDPATGWKIANSRLWFNGTTWNRPGGTSAHYLEVTAAPIIGTLVSNTGQAEHATSNHPLGSGHRRRAQAFTTGEHAGGYRLTSAGVIFDLIHADADPDSELTVTIREWDADDNPGDVLCTLSHPAAFAVSGLHTFDAPEGDDACPRLQASTSYFVEVERVAVHSGGIRLARTSSDAEDVLDPATGWALVDTSRRWSDADSRWESRNDPAMIEVRGLVLVEQPDKVPTGEPTVSISITVAGTGPITVHDTLTVDTSAIADGDGLENAEFTYQWVRTSGGVDADITGATSQSYTLVPADGGNTVKVKVSFSDDEGTSYTLTSAATSTVAAAQPGLLMVRELTVAEGSAATYTVRLATEPADDVEIDVVKLGGSSDVTVPSATLTFTSSNWDAPQTVTVTAAADADSANDLAVITHTVDAANSDNDYDDIDPVAVVVTVADDETVKLVGTRDGGETDAVQLGNGPDDQDDRDAQLFTTGPDPSGYAMDSVTLWFGPSRHLQSGQASTLAVVMEIAEVVQLQPPAVVTSAPVGRGPGDVICTLVSPDAYVENGENVFAVPDSCPALAPNTRYAIVLRTLSTSNYRVLAKGWQPDFEPYADADSANGWRADGDCVGMDSSIPYWHRCNLFAGFSFVLRGGVAAVPGVAVSPSAMEVTEFGVGTFEVDLATAPAADVTVELSVGGDLTVSPGSLTFTANDWDTPKSVTVSALDFDLPSAMGPTETVSLVVADGSSPEYLRGAAASVEVTVVEGVPGVSVSAAALNVTENASSTYEVVLDARPSASVTVNVAVTGDSDVTVSPQSLMFSTTDWQQPQMVTVSAADDADLLYSQATVSHTVVHGAATEYAAVTAGDVAVTVIDDEASALVSNTGQVRDDWHLYNHGARYSAQAFATGSSSSGYELASAGVLLRSHSAGSSGAKISAVIAAATPHATLGAVSGEVVCMLSAPAHYVRGAVNRFIASESCHLAPDTTYFFGLQRSAHPDESAEIWMTLGSDIDEGGTAGWSLPHQQHRRRGTGTVQWGLPLYSQIEIAGATLPGLVVSDPALTLGEDSSGTYTVALSVAPASDVVIKVARLGGSTDVTVSPATLTFTSSNWDQPQTVTVTAADDADSADDLAVITHTVDADDSDDAYDDMAAVAVVVTVADDETVKLVGTRDGLGSENELLNAGELSVQEFTTGPDVSGYRIDSLTVWLGAYNGLAQGDASTLALEMTITELVPHGVPPVDGFHDPPARVPGHVVCTLVSPDSYVENSEVVFAAPESCPALRPDTRYAIAATLLAASNHRVWLRGWQTDFPPWADADSAAGWEADRDCYAYSAMRSYWDECLVFGSFSIVLRGGVAAVPGVVVSRSSMEVTEFGEGTFEVELATEPAADVTVELSVGGALAVSPASLAFTPADWDTPRTVTVSALDFDLSSATSPTETVSLVVADGSSPEYLRGADAGVEVTVVEGVPGVTVSAVALNVSENASSTYTVALDAKPSASLVVVNVAVSGDSDVTVSPESLMFSTTDWQQPQTVTVSAADDADLLYSRATVSHTVVHGAASEYAAVTAGDIAVTVIDDEASVLVANTGKDRSDFHAFNTVIRQGSQAFATGSNSGGYELASVSLSLKSFYAGTSGEVTAAITAAVPDADVGYVPGEVVCTLAVPDRYQPDALYTFIATESCSLAGDTAYFFDIRRADRPYPGWDMWTTSAIGVDDGAAAGWSLPIGFLADTSPFTLVGASQRAQLEITGATLPGLVVSDLALTLGEDTSGSYTVALSVAPASDVVIEVARLGGSTDVTVSPAKLTFTPSNWDDPRTVTVAVADDTDAVGDVAVISHTVDADDSDAAYDDMAAVAVVVSVADNDDDTKLVGTTQGLTSSTSRSLSAANPIWATGFDTGPSPAGYRVGSIGMSLHAFVGYSAGVTETLVLQATIAEAVAHDSLGYIPGEVLCTLVSPGEYTAINAHSFAAPDSCPVLAPDTGYVVSLERLGASDYDVNMVSIVWRELSPGEPHPGYDLDSADGWSVSTSCGFYIDAEDRWVPCGGNGSGYIEVRGSTALVPDIGVSPASLEVTEFGKGAFEVALASEPAADVTVDLSVGGGLTVLPASLSFTSADWDAPQTVTVSALSFDLPNAVSPTETVSLAVADGSSPEYLRGAAAGVEVTVVAGVVGATVSETSLDIDESGSGTYTVALGARPASDVVIDVALDDDSDSDVTVLPTSLTFTTTDWQDPKTVTVSAADDTDSTDDTATVTHTVDDDQSDNDYDDLVIASVAVSVQDDDPTVIPEIGPPPRVTGFALDGDNADSWGVWGDPETIWVANDDTGTDNKIFAYQRSDGSRDADKDFDTLNAAGNQDPRGICSDGTTMFVADSADNDVYAYKMSDRTRDSAKDITLDSANDAPSGVWCDAGTVWVANDGTGAAAKVFAYQRSDGSHDSAKDLESLYDSTAAASDNATAPRGLWSDGATMFVTDSSDDKVFAYKLSDESQDSDKNITLDSENADPRGLWFDGRVLWVADNINGRLYVYDLRGAQPDNTPAVGEPVVRSAFSTDVYTASVGVANGPPPPPSSTGYAVAGIFFNAFGTITETEFTVDGVAYTVRAVLDGNDFANSGDLTLELDKALPRGFTLTADGVSYSSDDAAESEPGTGRYRYTWSAGLSWSLGSSIQVALSVETPNRGEEVSADVSGITDSTDGVANASYQYQWIRVDGTDETDIDGETGQTYTPTAADVGKHLKVRVVFDDDAGNKEYPRTSPQVGPAVDPDKVIVSVSELTVAEGGMGTYTVVLDVAPDSNVVIDVAMAVGSDTNVSVSPAQLTFTADNWSTLQTVTVSTTGDDDSVDDTATVTHAVVDADSDDAFDGVSIAGVAVTVTDNDPVGITLSVTSLSLTEAGSVDVTGSYMVELASQPSGDVMVDISVPGLESYETVTVMPSQLTFTADDWSTAQNVTVTSPVDDNGADISATILHEVASGSAAEYASVTAELPVSVADTSVVGINTASGRFTDKIPVLEGSTSDFPISLFAKPTADVTVNVAVTGGLTVSSDGVIYAPTASVTFTSGDYSMVQFVTVAAAQDANLIHETETITLSVAAGSAAEYVSKAMPLTESLIVADDDTMPGVTVTPLTLEVGEGDTKTYSVVLEALPSAPVAVSTGSEDAAVATAVPGQLVFDVSDWNTAQTVTVTGVADDADMADGSTAIAHAVLAVYTDNGTKVSALEYVELENLDSVAVSVVDDDRPSVSVSELPVAEGGMGTYTVVLNVAPASNVVIDVALSDDSDGDVTVSPASLTFTPSGTGIWSTPQTVTVSAAEDDDSIDDTAEVTHVVDNDDSDSAYEDVPIAGVAVTVVDDDPVGLTLSKSSVHFAAEGNSGQTYTVELASKPTADVTVEIAVVDLESYETVTVSTDGMNFAATASWTFTPSTWNIAQTVTVKSPADDNAADIAARITHDVDQGSAAEYVSVGASLPVSVVDPETAGILLTASPGVPETLLEGFAEEYTVKPLHRPTTGVVFRVAAGMGLTVRSDGVNFSSSVDVEFTPLDWSTAKTVIVKADQDGNSIHEAVTITASVVTGAAEYVDDASAVTLSLVVADDDTSPGVTVAPVTLSVDEGGTATYSVVLDALPSAPVAVSVTSGDAAVATAVPAQLVFDVSNWSMAQTVTVTGVADDTDMADGTATVAHAVVAEYGDPVEYSALEYAAAVARVAVSVVDDDRPTVSTSELTVAEGGTGTYSVVLDVAPGSPVVIDIAVTGDSDVTVSSDGNNFAATASLTFTPSGTGIWSTPQVVTVSAAEDDDSIDDTAEVTHVVDNDDSDSAYDNVPIESVAVTVVDNDEADTTVDLVKNTGQTAASGPTFEVSLGEPVAQSFTTGPDTRYELDSIGFSFSNIADVSTAGSELTVRLNEDSSGLPGRILCILEDPSSFASSGTHTFTAPTTGANRCPQLSANTTYFAVLERTGLNDHEIKPHLTQSSSEDDGSSPGWTVGLSYTTVLNSGWLLSSGRSHMIEVKGSVSTEVEVPQGWSLIPSGLAAGDAFRLLFVTGTANPTDTDIADYNTYVGDQAAAGHTDIADYSSWFRVVGSTADTDARDNTGTAYTADDKGVPVYWLGGAKVADDYEDFYDGGWDDEANPKGADGAAVTVDRVWTGSTNTGTEADASTESGSTTTVSRALGADPARVGRLNNSASGPLDSSEAYTTGTNYPYYALSGVMVVGEALNSPANGVPTISGTVSVNEVLTAVTSGIMDPDGTDSATFLYQWIRVDGVTEADVGTDSATYTLTDADIGKRILVKVGFIDDEGNLEGPISSRPTVVVNGPAAGAPTISGTPRVGRRLTAATTDITDPNGTGSAAFAYQWVRVDGVTEADVGTDSAAYTLTEDDAGHTIKVKVSFTDDGGVEEGPLESLATETVVAGDVLVQNTAKPAASPAVLTSANSRFGQRFTTGSHVAGYTLSSIGVPFTEIGDTSTVGAELTVTLNAESSGAPGEALCTLSDPATFSASGLHSFSPPTTGTDLCPELAPGATYFVVLSRANGNTDAIKWSATGTLGADSGSLAGWSVDDRGHLYEDTSSAWSQFSSSENLLIEVKGAADNAITVPVDWSLLPAEVTNGDRFRVLFVTGTGNPTSSDIATYNTYVQGQAAAGHTDIADYSHWFRVVGSTTSVDARDNTGTTYTADDKGVPIYWLGGVKVVDDYEDFYDGGWDDEANPRGANGAAVTVDRIWTGSTDAGTEKLLPDNASLAIGNGGSIQVGRLDHSSSGPLDANSFFVPTTNWPFYALSGLFEVGEGNFAPRFAARTATRTLEENSAAGAGVVGGAVAAVDRDSADTLAYTLTGTDAGSFDIDSSGQITTKTGVTHSFDFEDAGNNSFSVTVNVSDAKDVDGDADTAVDDTIAVTIDLTNVNEAPVITTTSAEFTAFNVDENTAISAAIKTYEATDPDADTTLTWSLEGTDAGDFTITENAQGHGELKFAAVPDFETPVDGDTMNDYDVTVKVTDNGIPANRGVSDHLDDTVDVTVTVLDINEASVGVTVSESALTVGEGDATGATYTVVLDVAPSSDVVIDITATGDLTVSSDGNNFAATATLTFTASGSGIWSTPQTVTVRAGHDDDKTDDTATVSHTVNNAQSDNDYDGHSIDAVTVTVEDDDVGVTVSESALTVGEGDATGATYTVVLDVAPSSDVVIDITATGDLTVSSDGNNAARRR